MAIENDLRGISVRYQRVSVASLIGGALLMSSPVQAQEEAEGIEEVVVTGSRIQRSGMNTPTPVTVVDAEQLRAMAPGNMIEGLSQMPQFNENEDLTGGGAWFTRGGYGNLNLRGLGINRTLTLLNGRRMISATAFGGVDINAFPEVMIQSVETVTGGASAAYGTDAVAGVTNFVLDTDFVGFRTHAQYGQTGQGDANSSEFSLAFGTDIGERGHFLFSAETWDQDGIHSYDDRGWFEGWGTVPDDNGMLRLEPMVASRNSSLGGLIQAPGSAIDGMEFLSDGTTQDFILSDVTYSPAPLTVGVPPARQSIQNGGSGDVLTFDRPTVLPDNERRNLFLYGDFELTSNVRLYGQVIRGNNETWRYYQQGASLNGTPTAATIFADNAFLPDSVRQVMADEGLESFTFRRFNGIEDLGGMTAIWDDNEMTSYTGGITLDVRSEGFFDGWQVDSYLQIGKNEREWFQHGMRVDRIHAALDAVVDPDTGDVVCRSTLFSDVFDGCQPINLFGEGNASAEAMDWVMGYEPGQTISTPIAYADTGFERGDAMTYVSTENKVNLTDMDQVLFEIAADGVIAEGWGAGEIAGAVGASYRKDEIIQLVQDPGNPASDHSGDFLPVRCNDPGIGLRGVSSADCQNTVATQYSKVSNIVGDIDVTELFGEALIPLIGGRPYMDSMTMNVAARWADYSETGEIWAWKGGLDLQFTPQVRLRATASRDVRAANLSERFDRTGGITNVFDPEFDNEDVQATFFSGGNPEVQPEEADTLTAGIVYQPAFVDGLSMSLDGYDIEIDGAIGTLGTQAVVNECFAGAQALCEKITRDPVTNRLVLIGDTFINIDSARVRGVDLEVRYRHPGSFLGGDFGTTVFASWLHENSETNAGAAKIDRAGQTGVEVSTGVANSLPDFRLNQQLTYNNGPLSAFVQGRYIADGTMENTAVEGVDIEDNSVDSAFYTDLNLSYLHEMRNGSRLEFYGNIANLFDEEPPLTPSYSIFLARPQQTNGALFDELGRRYTFGLRYSL